MDRVSLENPDHVNVDESMKSRIEESSIDPQKCAVGIKLAFA
jgi:hypothetical protein